MGNPARGATVSERPLNEFEQGILDNIEKSGCQVNTIFDPDGDEPTFSYSIGFPKTVGQPEVIIFGLRNEVMHSMINALLGKCRQGLKLRDGLVIDDLLDGYNCVARVVVSDYLVDEYFASAIWYEKYRTGGEMEEAYQIVWPGVQQRLFPWDEGCDQIVIDSQPALYHPETVH
ncbi:DUF4262 domain-containing protein [Qipengyuania aurantiaca]|uniref:DUF4262 domain-containing protein n=1 Tax=Qipengyuania aurantiaca TaxID=2867233 RepID=A0ABX8ZMA5_9SPHN|nr:DUF4262 domain-containing protein [Qipengyuania aurantiaca]